PMPVAPAAPRVTTSSTREPDLHSALSFAIFAAINRSFGAYGKSLLKHASERFLEYETKRGILPPRAANAMEGLNQFFQQLVNAGYARRVRFEGEAPTGVCHVEGVAEWDAVEALRQLSYPLLPAFPAEIIQSFLSKYYNEIVVIEGTDITPETRGLVVRFTHRPRAEETQAPIPEVRRTELYE
ncbi:MAG TPA: hypothetical protein VNZ52_07155, partial [Candidatus Thermoplasmatota archaeon]|nr:hypothetical protein [Candidatus Thermoplasmatota archaeon]